jgi:hypothetical protein
MRTGRLLPAVLAVALWGASARADTISFDFTTVPIGLGSSFTYSNGGLSLVVNGTNTIGTKTTSALITRSIFGLGVVGLPSGDPLEMDGVKSTESLVFDFSPHEVVIDKMQFRFVDSKADHDEVLLTVFGNGAKTSYDLTTQGTGTVNFDFTKAVPLLNAQQRTGMKFVASTTDWNDDYTIAGLTVDYAPYVPPVVVTPPPIIVVTLPGPANAVPLPPTVWGGGALLALSGCVRWFRKRKASGEITSE